MSKENKKPRLFDFTRLVIGIAKNEKPGDASGDLLIIFLPVALVVDVIALPWVIYKMWRKGK